MSEKTYWNAAGKYQKEVVILENKVPPSGEAKELHIELLRNIVNCYYDHFNNGNMNWDNKQEQFNNIRYNRNRLKAAAEAENEDIDYLLNSIKQILDKTLIEENSESYYEEDEYYYYELTKTEEALVEESYEKLANIIIKWAWEVENGL